MAGLPDRLNATSPGYDAAEKAGEAVLKEIGPHPRLAVDANGRFDLETAIAYAKMLREYDLVRYEVAGDPLDYRLQAALAEFYPAAMATGENLFSHRTPATWCASAACGPTATGCSSTAR